MENNSCQFCIEIDGKLMGCGRKAGGGIMRCMPVCSTHFWMLKKDNTLRGKKGIEIPNDFSLIIKPTQTQINLCNKLIEHKPINDYTIEEEEESENLGDELPEIDEEIE